MNIDAIYGNLAQMKNILKEIYIFSNQLAQIQMVEASTGTLIESEEKRLLKEAVSSLKNQFKILNNSIPKLISNIGFYKKLSPKSVSDQTSLQNEQKKLIQVTYNPEEQSKKISLIISDQEKKEFLENLSKSNLSIDQLKKKYSIEKPLPSFGKPSLYAKISNSIFRDISNSLISKNYFNNLNSSLRKINSPFVVNTYVSMMLFTSLLMTFFGIIVFILLLFFDMNIIYPFLSVPKEINILSRIINFFWIIPAVPIFIALFMYLYPAGLAKNIGSKINQELPFVVIHMAAIATSGVEPVVIFKIILKSKEYKYTNIEFTKLINLINFHGKDLITALKTISASSPSTKLKELMDGLATTITSGGDQKEFLDKHSESLLFDYKLEREKYTKTSETFMDIYISVVIAAPMIFLMMFVIMGSTGLLSAYLGIGVSELNLLMLLGIALINLGFLGFLKIKQPAM